MDEPMREGSTAGLGLLLFFVSCSSGAGDLAHSAESAASWGATARFVATEWERGSAPARYSADTLRAGEEELAGTQRSVAALKVTPEKIRSVTGPAQRLQLEFGKLAQAIEQGDQAGVDSILRRIDSLTTSLRKIAQEGS